MSVTVTTMPWRSAYKGSKKSMALSAQVHVSAVQFTDEVMVTAEQLAI
jgi:hypothetical protein